MSAHLLSSLASGPTAADGTHEPSLALGIVGVVGSVRIGAGWGVGVAVGGRTGGLTLLLILVVAMLLLAVLVLGRWRAAVGC